MRSNTTNPNTVNPLKVVIEDATVVGLITFISGLLAKGYPPTPEVFYMVGLNSALTGLYAYIRSRGIKTEE